MPSDLTAAVARAVAPSPDPDGAVPPLPWTGERFIPHEGGPEIYYEHAHRYLMARPVATGHTVVDLGCGEGYGAAWLAGVAGRVTAVDIDVASVEHARARYREHANLEFAVADIQRLPLPSGTADVVTCFEAIEHVPDPGAVVAEAARILRPGGVLLVSTPDKAVYTDARDYTNEFHVHELYRPELEALLAEHFPERTTLGQRLVAGSLTFPLDGENGAGAVDHDGGGAAVLLAPGFAGEADRTLSDPLYVVVAARRAGHPRVPLALAPTSVLVDPDDLLLERYRRGLEPSAVDGLLDHLRHQDEELEHARAQLAEYERSLRQLESALRDNQPLAAPGSVEVAPDGSREQLQAALRRQQEVAYRLSLDLDAATELNVRLLSEIELAQRALADLQVPPTPGPPRLDPGALARAFVDHPRVPPRARAVLRRLRRAVAR